MRESKAAKMVLIVAAAWARGSSWKRVWPVKEFSEMTPPIQTRTASVATVSAAAPRRGLTASPAATGDGAEEIVTVGLAGGGERQHLERQADEPLVAQAGGDELVVAVDALDLDAAELGVIDEIAGAHLDLGGAGDGRRQLAVVEIGGAGGGGVADAALAGGDDVAPGGAR